MAFVDLESAVDSTFLGTLDTLSLNVSTDVAIWTSLKVCTSVDCQASFPDCSSVKEDRVENIDSDMHQTIFS